jgi:hypothetical protein
MKMFLSLILLVLALLYYVNDFNFNRKIDTEEYDGRLGSSINNSVFNKEKKRMLESDILIQPLVAPLNMNTLDLIIPRNQQQSLLSESLTGGTDDIGGHYDGNARSPESESHQYDGEITIGTDASNVFAPEMNVDFVNINGISLSIHKVDASSSPPET